MARLYFPTNDGEALLVGHAARRASDPSLYLCVPPESDLDSDGIEEVDPSCSGATPAR
jgi:hypothetical protein